MNEGLEKSQAIGTTVVQAEEGSGSTHPTVVRESYETAMKLRGDHFIEECAQGAIECARSAVDATVVIG